MKAKLCLFKLFAIIVFSTQAIFSKPHEEEDISRVRRDGGLTAAIVGAAISAGASLVGTTVSVRKSPQYTVAVSGGVSNFAKWNLRLDHCTIESGYMNVPMRSIGSGVREGFAGHKTGDTATGNWVKCSFTMNDAIVHFMYSAPYNFNFDANTLAVAICSPWDRRCNTMSASDMQYKAFSYFSRREYYYTVRPLKVCNLGLCVTGVMGTSHLPGIELNVYPMKYEDLATAVQDDSAKDRWDKNDYKNFIDKI